METKCVSRQADERNFLTNLSAMRFGKEEAALNKP